MRNVCNQLVTAKMEKLIITGASGLLGSKIVKLAKNDYRVIPLYNTKPLYPNSLKLDVTNQKQVSDLFSKLKPDVTIHTAAETNVDKCETQKKLAWKINVEGTRNVAEACSETNAKMVYISTDYVFDGEKGLYTEEDTPNPINHHGITKLEGENQVKKLCKNHIILRTSVLYGWHPYKQNFATWVINSLKQKKKTSIIDDHFNTPTLADNLAEITIEAVQKNLQGLYHASGSQRISRYEFAQQIIKTFNLNQSLIKPIRMNQITAWTAKRPKDSSLNINKIKGLLKTKPLNISEGLKKMEESAHQ